MGAKKWSGLHNFVQTGGVVPENPAVRWVVLKKGEKVVPINHIKKGERTMRNLLGEPVLITEAIRQTILALAGFGVIAVTGAQLVLLVSAVSALLAVMTRAASSPAAGVSQ